MKLNYKCIGDFISLVNNRNDDGNVENLVGLTIEKKFIPSVANTIGTDLTKYKIIRENQFACSLMQVGRDKKVPIACYQGEPAIISPAYTMFEVTSKELLPEYLNLWIARSEFDREASFLAVGGVRGNLEWEDFCRMKLPVPNIEQQRKIVWMYQTIEKRIKLKEDINDNLEKQAKIVTETFINKLDEYDIKTLDEIAECQNGHAFYKEGYDSEGALVVDLGNVDVGGNFIFTNADKYISMERYKDKKVEKYHVQKNDLVMVMTDRKSTMDLLGKTGKIYKDGKYILNQRMYRIRVKKDIDVNYLYSYLNSTMVSNFLKEQSLGSVQKYVNTGSINKITVKVPSKNKMKELSNMLMPIYKQIEVNLIEAQKLESLKELILPKLMSGNFSI